MAMNKQVRVEVAYALPHHQKIIQVEMEPGSTIAATIECSGMLAFFPDIDLTKQPVGVFSKTKQLFDIIKDGDRIEIYRLLTIDPKAIRRRKAVCRRKP